MKSLVGAYHCFHATSASDQFPNSRARRALVTEQAIPNAVLSKLVNVPVAASKP